MACSTESTEVESSTTESETSNSQAEESETEASETESSEESADTATDVKANEVVINGASVTAGTILTDDLLASFGDANETLYAPSCHFDGEDTIYYYDDFNIYSYTNGDDQVIYLIDLVSDKVSMSSGVKLGMTKDEAISILGEEYTDNGVIIRYDIDGVYFDLSIDENNTISLIEVIVD